MIVTPEQRPTQPGALGDQQRRIRAVEATLASGSGGLSTTDGTVTVNPTETLEISSGLVLTNPSAGTAKVVLASHTTGRERFSSNGAVVAAGATASLGIIKVAGDTLMSLTVPALPVISATGVYGISFNVNCTPKLTAGKACSFKFTVTPTTGPAVVLLRTFPADTAGTVVINRGAVMATLQLNSGSTFSVLVRNEDTANRTFIVSGGLLARLF